jgi:hypothetical protein
MARLAPSRCLHRTTAQRLAFGDRQQYGRQAGGPAAVAAAKSGARLRQFNVVDRMKQEGVY